MKENRTNNKENEKQEARMNSSKDLNVIWYFFVFAPKIDKKSRLSQKFPKISRKYHEIKNTFSIQENQDWWIPWNCFKHSGGIATKQWKILTPEK